MRMIIIIIFLSLFNCCTDNTRKIKIPTKPEHVPENTFWAGGSEGGDWYLIENISPDKTNAVIKVYDDHWGRLLISKKFILICPINSKALIENIEDQIASFDGQKIYFKPANGKKSCYLE